MKRPVLLVLLPALFLLGFRSQGKLPLPVVNWELDEGTGLIATDSILGLPGRLEGPLWTIGAIGNALSFDGADDYIEIEHDEALAVTGEMTVATWFRRNDILDDRYASILRKSEGVYQLFASDPGNRPFFGDAYGWVRASHRILLPGRWTFLAASAQGASVRIFADVRPAPIYTIGDSITAGHGGPHSHCTSSDNCAFSQGRCIEHTYQYWLDRFLGSFASAESTSASYYNKGHGSQTCDQIFTRFDSDIPDGAEVILLCGINDFALGSDATEVQADIEAIYELAMSKGNALAVMEILPDGPGLYCDDIVAFNAWLEDFAASHEGVSIVHVHDALSSGIPCQYNPSLYEADRVHPNEEGLETIAWEIWTQLYGGEASGLEEQIGESYAAWDGIDGTSIGSIFLGLREDLAAYPFEGLLDELMIFDRALNEAEIREIYESGAPTERRIPIGTHGTSLAAPMNRDPVENGDFESGALPPWENPVSDPLKWTVADTRPHGGAYSAFAQTEDLGGVHGLGQSFDPPIPVTETARLGLWYWAESARSPNLAVGLIFSDGSYDQEIFKGIQVGVWERLDASDALARHPGSSVESIHLFDTLETDLWMDDVDFVCIDADLDGDGHDDLLCGGDDCVDSDSAIHPGVLESREVGNCSDGIDNDCDGLVDTDPECNGGCFLGTVL